MGNIDRIKRECYAIIESHKPLTEYAAEDLEMMLECFEERDYLLDGAKVYWDDENESLCIEREAVNMGWTLIFDSQQAIEGGQHIELFEAGGNFYIKRNGKDVYSGGGAGTLDVIEPIVDAYRRLGGYKDN